MSIVTPEIMQTPANNYLVKHPDRMPVTWRRVTIETVRSGQSRAYADSIYEYLVTFEGGTKSAKEGWDLPFAIMPFPEPYDPGTTVISGPTQEEREEQHWEKIRRIMKVLVHDWSSEKDSRGMGDTYLDTLGVYDNGPAHTTYRIVVITPYMD